MIDVKIAGVGAITSGLGALANNMYPQWLAQIDTELAQEVGGWPITTLALGVCALCVWLMYKMATANMLNAAGNMDKVAAELNDLNKNLSERPCVRNPEND